MLPCHLWKYDWICYRKPNLPCSWTLSAVHVLSLFPTCWCQWWLESLPRLQMFFTVRNSRCEKVTFSQVCVKNSVPGGEVYTPKQTDTPRQTATPRWGKIMFYTCLQFYLGGGGGIPAYLAGYQAHSQGELEGLRGLTRSTPRGEVEGSGWGGLKNHTQGSPWAHTRGVWRSTLGGVSQHALRQTPQQMATAAGGTHSTGMHSCF